jgi:hypothetical protein
MLIAASQIDDFKTDRKDIASPLPLPFRLVPILFYLSIVFTIVVGSLALWHAKVAADLRDATLARIAEVRASIEANKASRGALEARIREAMDLEKWVLASKPLQPLVIAIIRSMGPESNIVELRIERDTVTPSQLRIGLRMNTASDRQLEETLKVIRDLNYREVSPTQSRSQGELNYQATLVWQKDQAEGELPTELKR